MSLDVHLFERNHIYTRNITHNLGKMASKAGIYYYLWRPEEIGVEKAEDLIKPLEQGLYLLKSKPEEFKKYNSENGWGLYEHFVEFVEDYLEACKKYPEAEIEIRRNN